MRVKGERQTISSKWNDMKRIHYWLCLCVLCVILSAGCSHSTSADDLATSGWIATASETPGATSTPWPASTPTNELAPTLDPAAWMSMPVIPGSVSERTLEIYAAGQALGNDPHAFSRMGDCDSQPFSFLGDFDEGPGAYVLGDDYAYLQVVIDYFQGSYGRTGVVAKDGFSTASALSPLWADPDLCEVNETPLACEVRLHKPAFMLILLGTNDYHVPERFERNMPVILDFLVQNGVVPILATKADNLESDHSINEAIAMLAYEYQVPLWNYWLAVQSLPNHGIRTDNNYTPTHPGFEDHLPNDFTDPWKMTFGFPIRNLTALQMLDLVMRSVNSH